MQIITVVLGEKAGKGESHHRGAETTKINLVFQILICLISTVDENSTLVFTSGKLT